MKTIFKLTALALCSMAALSGVANAADSNPVSAPVLKAILAHSDAAQLGCDSFKNFYLTEAFKPGKSSLKVEQSVMKAKRLLEGSKLECQLGNDYSAGDGHFTLSQMEVGTIKGAPVRVWLNDGSGGSVRDTEKGGWSTHCNIDAMSDAKLCYIAYKDVMIFKQSTGYSISIGADNFPGSTTSIRIDGGAPISTDDKDGMFSTAASTRALKSIHNGSVVKTRFVKWPYETYVDGQLDTSDFEAAMATLDLVYANYQGK